MISLQTVTLINDDAITVEKNAHSTSRFPLDKITSNHSESKPQRTDDSDSFVLCLRTRLQTGSKIARELVKSKHLADSDAPIENCLHLTDAPCQQRFVEPTVSNLRGQVDSLARQLAVANSLKVDTDAKVAELEDLLNLAFTGINQLRDRNQELDSACTDYEHALKGSDERARDSQTMLLSAVSQVEQLTSENEKLADQKAALYNALSSSLTTSGHKQTALETQIHELKAKLAARDAEIMSVREELLDARKTADDRVKAVKSAWEKKVEDAINQRARIRVEAIEHKHKVVYLEKQKAATEEALATCKSDLRAMTLKFRTAQDELKLANVQAEAARKRKQACERHISFLESMVPVEGKEAKRLTDLSNKLEKTMARSRQARAPALHDVTNRRGTIAPLIKDFYEDSPAPARPLCKGPLAKTGHVSDNGTKYALSFQDKRFSAVHPASPRVPEPDWSMLSDSSSASFIKMHASNLDISEGELLFGSLGTPATTFVHTPPIVESRTRRSMFAPSNKTPRVTTRRRL